MGTNFQQLQNLILASELSNQDKSDFLKLFQDAYDADLKDIVELCSVSPLWIRILSANLKSKRKAFVKDDPVLMETLLQTEVEHLDDVLAIESVSAEA
jgi:hypothetical protein